MSDMNLGLAILLAGVLGLAALGWQAWRDRRWDRANAEAMLAAIGRHPSSAASSPLVSQLEAMGPVVYAWLCPKCDDIGLADTAAQRDADAAEHHRLCDFYRRAGAA